MRRARSGERFTWLLRLAGQHRLLAAVLLLVASTGAAAVALLSGPSNSDRARSEQVRATLDAYLHAATTRQGAAACRLLTPAAQQSLLIRVVPRGTPTPSCQDHIDNPQVQDSSSSTAVTLFPVVVDNVGKRTATAHEQGSSIRTALVETSDGWRIQGWSFGPPTATPSSPTKTRLFFTTVWLISFAIGLRGTRWRSIAILPVLFLIMGAVLVAQQPAGYDMPGFGYLVGIAYALITFTVSAVGRLIHDLFQAIRRRPQVQ